MKVREELCKLIQQYNEQNLFATVVDAKFVDFLIENGVTVVDIPVQIGTTVYELRAKTLVGRKYDTQVVSNSQLRFLQQNKRVKLYVAPKKFCKSDKVRLEKFVFRTYMDATKALCTYMQMNNIVR